MKEILVEFWHCVNCKKAYRSPRAMFQQLAPFLPNQSTGNAPVILLCDACNAIRSYNKTALPDPYMKDSSDSGQFVFAEKIFLAHIGCADNTCKYQIEIVVPATRFWTDDSLRISSKNWKPDATIACKNGHPASSPISVLDLRPIFEPNLLGESDIALQCLNPKCDEKITISLIWLEANRELHCNKCGKDFTLSADQIRQIKKAHGKI
jgi:hypothetical protein